MLPHRRAIIWIPLAITLLLLSGPTLAAQEIVDPRSGQLFLSVTDLTVQAGPVTLEVRRSLESGPRQPGLLGTRWRMNWESRLVRAGPLVLIEESTGSLSFSQQGPAGEYRSALGDRLVLEKTGHAIRTRPDGTKELFDAQGRLVERDYRNGNRAVLSYGSDGRLAKIDGPHGSYLKFTADKAGRLTQVEASTTATVRYAYQGDDLTEVQRPPAPPIRYSYFTGGQLARIEEPQFGTVRFDYDFKGRVSRRQWADGSKERYEYDDRTNTIRQIDPAGGVTTIQWSQDKRRAEITNPLKHKSVIVSDTGGRPLQVTGPTGMSARLTYDALGRTIAMENPAGQVTRFEYLEETSRPRAMLRPDGTRQLFEYDRQGNLTTIKLGTETLAAFTYHPDGSVATAKGLGTPERRLTYDPTGRLKTASNALGQTTQFQYGARGNLLRVTNPLGGATRHQYDAQDRPVSRTDPVGGITRYEYDPQGRLSRIIDPIGGVTRYQYDARGRLMAITNPAGQVTRCEYDAIGRVVRIVQPDNRSGSLRYDAAGNLVGFTNALGRITRLEHDALGRLVRRRSDTSLETTYQYDPLGRLLAWGNSLGAGATLTYDAIGRLAAGVSLDGTMIQYAYDAVGRPSEIIQPGGKRHRLTYNRLGQLDAAAEPSGASGRYEYDAAGRVSAIQHPGGGVTRLHYDGLGNLLGLTDPLGHQLRHAYDQAGRRLRTTDPLGRTTSFTYDARGQLLEKRFASGKSVRHEYGPMGELRRADDGAFPMQYAYDAQGRLTSVEYLAIGKSVRFTYNALGLREKVIDAHGRETLYRYDGLARLSEIVLPGGSIIVFSYDPGDRLISIRYPNGVEARWAFDAAGQATALTYRDNAGKVLAGWNIRYDGLGNPVRVDRAHSTLLRYEYDPDSRLIAERRDTQATIYSYSPGGNRASERKAGTMRVFRYDAADQLLEAGTERFIHDAAGNLVRRSQPNGNTSYEYAEEGRLARVVTAGGATTAFGYAPTGERVWRREGTGLTHFLYDGWNLLQELPADGTASPLYIHGTGIDRPLAMLRDGQQYFFLVDPLGSVVALTDGQGQVAATYEYDAFGALVAQTGSLHSPFRFTAREYESGLGLYYYRHRYYDPAVGRFLSRDPRAARLQEPATLNGYAYVRNNPLKYTDPLGLEGSQLFWHYTSNEHGSLYQNNLGGIPASKAGTPLSVDTAGLPSSTTRNVFLTDIPPPPQFKQGMLHPWDAYPEWLPENLVEVGAASYQRAIPIYETQIKAQGLPIFQDPRNPNIFMVPAEQVSLNVEPGSGIPPARPGPPAPSGTIPGEGPASSRITPGGVARTLGTVANTTLAVGAVIAGVTHIVTSDHPAQAAVEVAVGLSGGELGAVFGGAFLGPPGALIGGLIGGMVASCLVSPCAGGGPIPYLPPEQPHATNPPSTTDPATTLSTPASPVPGGTTPTTYVPLPPEKGPPAPTLIGPPGPHPFPADPPPSPLPPPGERSVDPSAPSGGETRPPFDDPRTEPGLPQGPGGPDIRGAGQQPVSTVPSAPGSSGAFGGGDPISITGQPPPLAGPTESGAGTAPPPPVGMEPSGDPSVRKPWQGLLPSGEPTMDPKPQMGGTGGGCNPPCHIKPGTTMCHCP